MGKKSVAVGKHNQNAYKGDTYIRGNTYKDRSTVIFTPSRGSIPVRVVQAWNALQKPMNQKTTHIFLVNQEVGKAYEQMVDIIRSNPELKTWRYVVTLEEDNAPPPDGLLKLYEDMDASGFDAIGSLYWTKGEPGTAKPMCYGRPDIMPLNFVPWLPPANSVAQCNGLGMGFTIFKTKMFLDERFARPIFKTEQSYDPQKGVRAFTQDLYFAEAAHKLGYRFGCSTRVLTGHYDLTTDTMH